MTTPRPKTAYMLGTWFGMGFAPRAPGTVGSLGALPLHWILIQLPPTAHLLSALAIMAVGVWASQLVARHRAEEDPSCVVIDEVAGVVIAMGLVRDQSWWIQALAWVLFRAFDILKPPPIRQAEHLKPPGVGIMLDDVLAGLLAGALMLLV